MRNRPGSSELDGGAGVDRREILKRGVFGLGVAAAFPALFTRTASALARPAARRATTDRILVVLQLSGGNDGLSTVVPFEDDAYYRARKSTAIAKKDVIRVTETLGLHPHLGPLAHLLEEGRMAVVQGTSYPNPNRSHFKSMDIWHAGDLSGRRVGAGWLGRCIDASHRDDDDPRLMIHVGRSVPFSLLGHWHRPVSFTLPQNYRWEGEEDERPVFQRLNGAAVDGEASDNAAFVHQVAADARASSEQIREIVASTKSLVSYPSSGLARDLRNVSALIRGGLPTRVYHVALGGFDTHTNQRQRHDSLMTQLAEAVASFQADLVAGEVADRVVMLAFSEFGRRVQENASGGTDHGAAGPMFLFGTQIRPGLHGPHPDLLDLERGDLKMTTDFRSAYAAVIEDWLGGKASAIVGGGIEKLALFS